MFSMYQVSVCYQMRCFLRKFGDDIDLGRTGNVLGVGRLCKGIWVGRTDGLKPVVRGSITRNARSCT